MTLPANKKINSKGFAHVEILIALVVVVVIVLVGSVIYQRNADSSYEKNVKSPYNSQAQEMALAYKSFSRPVFSTNDSSTSSDNTDLKYINSVIKTASADTDTLKSKDSLTVIPGTTLAGSVNTANKEHNAMKTYVANSQAFLTDYQTLSTYTSGLDNIGDTDLTNVFNILQDNPSSVSQLLSESNSASTALDKTINDLNKLKPPVDMKVIQTKLVSSLKMMDSDFKNLSSSINNSDATGITNASKMLTTDSQSLEAVAKTDVSGMIQGNSVIHKQILTLESEKPLLVN